MFQVRLEVILNWTNSSPRILRRRSRRIMENHVHSPLCMACLGLSHAAFQSMGVLMAVILASPTDVY